jgi:ABC-type thiamin/hydroxymethylpyrimidine transport system permease subunit
VVDRRTRLLLLVSLLLVVSGLFHLLVFFLDDRPWAGPLSWRKPFDFGVSFGVTLATVVWVTSYLRVPRRTRSALLSALAADCVVEVAGITLQAWRDVPSHLNRSTPFNTVVAVTLAIGGAVLIGVLGWFAVAAVRGRTDAAPSMRLALRAGFVLLLLGLLSGAAMIARGTVAMNTGTPAHAYAVTGFLKEFHGVTLHGVLVLPAVAWLLGRTSWSESRRLRVIGAGVAAYAVAALAVLLHELSAG